MNAAAHQDGAPADAGDQHDGHELTDHLQVVGRGAAALPLPEHPGAHQREAGHRVAQDRHQERQQPHAGEEQRQQQVQPVAAVLGEEAPAARSLDAVGAARQDGQRGHDGGREPERRQQLLGVPGGERHRVEDGPRDTQTALHRHAAAQQQGAQAEEDHGGPKEAAEDIVRVDALPVHAEAINIESQAAVDEMPQEVGDHQAAGEQQEGSLGLEAEATVGLDEDDERQGVGEHANGHGDHRDHDGEVRPHACDVGRGRSGAVLRGRGVAEHGGR